MKNLRLQFEEVAAVAFVELGLSEDDFFRQTPRQWQRRVAALREKNKREDYRVARLCATFAMCQGAQDVTVEDFMPEQVVQDEDEMTRILTGRTPTIQWQTNQ